MAALRDLKNLSTAALNDRIWPKLLVSPPQKYGS
jgi:hypothetical protein